jgi:putative PIN family toxin of toxin-antitoxin system
MIIVLDTNIIIAAFATEGLCHSLFELCVDQHEIYICDFIILELSRNFDKKLKLPRNANDNIIDYLTENATLQNPPALPHQICRDKNDDIIISLADTVKAPYLITGDNDLLELKRYKNTRIITPREFWEILRNKK